MVKPVKSVSNTQSATKSARIPRVWVDEDIPSNNLPASIDLPKRAAHHLFTVLRAQAGISIELFNGNGYNYLAQVSGNGKKAQATVLSASKNLSESPLHTVLVQSISRGDRMDTSIQKCVELGVSEIQPVYTRHSIPLLKGERANRKTEHWQAIAISAAEQSHRSVVPKVHKAIALTDWLETAWKSVQQQNTLGWVLNPSANQKLTIANLSQPQNSQRHVLLVGPETGLEPDEIAAAEQAGFTGIRFGPRILRTETAGPAVLAALQSIAGDLLA